MKTKLLLMACSAGIFISCSPARQIAQSARQNVIQAAPLQTAHVGISVYDASTGRYLYNYQGDRYFVPASNTKIPTCYAAMKYLGDSLVGLRYETENNYTNVLGTGDPTFLHPDFKSQPVFNFLKKINAINYSLEGVIGSFSPRGRGWTFDDYLSDYAAERSEMPIYGNVVKFYMQADTIAVSPTAFYNDNIQYANSVLKKGAGPWYEMVRPFENNAFHALSSSSMYRSKTKFPVQSVPFKTILGDPIPLRNRTFIRLLEDTLHKKMGDWSYVDAPPVLRNVIHSQPTDTLLRLMMHRSDNFFAEQSLLMVSDALLGRMDDARIIDTLLKTDFKDLPHTPRWVDGSGLSRYNLFTPQDFVAILNKMRTDFGMDRVKAILPTGNEGTLAGRFAADSNFIYAKTGTLSGVVSLSGFLYTKKNKLLIFSVLVNNHQASAADVRRAVEKFVGGLREKY